MSNRMYTEEELVKFGNWVLSNERRQMIGNHPELPPQVKQMLLYTVSDADVNYLIG